MAFMWSAIKAWRSAGVLAFIILSCISRMAFMRSCIAGIEATGAVADASG